MRDQEFSDDALHLETFLPYRLSRLSNRISGELARIYTRRHQLSVTEWRIMAILGRFHGLSAREVAEQGALDKVAVSRGVARLLESGLLVRHTHAVDRRRSVLDLSEQGRAVYDEIVPEALAYEARLLSTLSGVEQKALQRILDKLGDALSKAAES